MKKKQLLMIVAIFLQSALQQGHRLYAQEISGSYNDVLKVGKEETITVQDYCSFLNAEQAVDCRLQTTGSEETANHSDRFLGIITASNLNNFYDERMLGASIVRTGLPGNYCYNLISNASTDNFNSCIAGLSRNDAERYCEWKNSTSTATFNLNSSAIGTAHVDPLLKSNQLTFCLVSTGANAYEASGEEAVLGGLSEEEILEDILAAIGIATGGEGVRRSTTDHALSLEDRSDLEIPMQTREEEIRRLIDQSVEELWQQDESTEVLLEQQKISSNKASLTLEDVKHVVEANPTTARFIITEEDGITSIYPQEEIPNAGGRNRSENKKTIDALRSLIPSGVADDLLRYRTGTVKMHVDPLSAQRLSAILNRYDEYAQREAANLQPQASDCFMPHPPRLQTGQEIKFKGRDPKYQQLKTEDQDILLSQKSILTELETDPSSPRTPVEFSVIIEFQKALHQIVSRDQSDLAPFYKAADSVWKQTEEAWSHRIDAFQTKEAREKAHEQASQLLAKVEEATTTEALQSNLLGSITKNTKKIAKFLENRPGKKHQELDSLIATASATIDKINKIGGKTAKILALLNETITGYLEKAAAVTFEDAKNKAPLLENEAQQEEEAAQRAETTATLELAKSLMLPVEGSDETLWTQWASRISAKSKSDNTSWITTIVSQGMRDSASIATAVAASWAERIEYSKAYVQHLESTDSSKIQCLQELYKKLLEAKKKASTAETNISAAQENFETIAQQKNRLQAELKEHNQALDEFIRKKEFLKTEEVMKNISAAVKQLEESLKNLEEAEKEMTRAFADEFAAKEEMSRCAQDYKKAEKTFLQEIERAKARLEGDQGEALELIWPEKAQELREQADREAIIKAKVKEGIQRIFLTHVTSSSQSEPPVRVEENIRLIRPPLLSDEELERIGRKILGIEKEETSLKAIDPVITLREHVREEIRREALKENEDNQQRWNARKTADEAREGSALVFVKQKNLIDDEQYDDGNTPDSNEVHSQNCNLDSASSTTRSSVLASVRSALSDTISTISNISGIILYTRLKKIDPFARNIKRLEQVWTDLAIQANEQRIKAGGANIEEALGFWREADRDASQAKTIEEAKKDYATNHAARWLARAETDELEEPFLQAVQQAIEKAEQLILDSNSRLNYSSKSYKANIARVNLKKAKSEWDRMAQEFLGEDLNQDQTAREELKEDDRAVIVFLEQVLRDYYKDYESPYQQQERSDKEKQVYEQKLSELIKIFEQADAAFKEADETAETLLINDTSTNREKARELDDEAHQLEERVIRHYEETTVRLALEGARKQVPGAIDIWKKQVTEKNQQAQEAEKTFKEKKKPSNKDERILERAISIATANKNAWEVFKEEVESLTPLETIWREFLETEANASKLKQEHAVKNYIQDSTLWESLTPQERSEYEMCVRIRNWIHNNAIQEEIDQAANKVQELRKKANRIFPFFSRQSAEQAAKEANIYYNKLKEAEEERQKVIQCEKLTPEEKEEMIREKKEKAFLLNVHQLIQKSAQVAQEEGWEFSSYYKNAIKNWDSSMERKMLGEKANWSQIGVQFKNLVNQFKQKSAIAARDQEILWAYLANMTFGYQELAIQEAAGTVNIAQEYRKAILWSEAAVTNQQEAIELEAQGKKELAEDQRRIAAYQNNIGHVFYQAATQEAAGKRVTAEEYRKAIPWFEAAVTSRQEAIELETQGKKELAEDQRRISVYQDDLGDAFCKEITQEAARKSKIIQEY